MAYSTELDQSQRFTQDVIATESFTNGETDGYDGVYPQSSEYNYLAGYLKGIRRFASHIQEKALLLQKEAEVTESFFYEF